MPSRKTLVYWLLVLGVLSWVLLTLIAPLLCRIDQASAANSLRLLFRPLCHQLPERSLHLAGYPAAVCARCLGIYCGFLAGLVVFPGLGFLSSRLLQRPRLLLFFVAPMFLDALIWGSFAWARAASGFLAAFPIALFVWIGMDQLKHWRRS